MSIKLKDRAVDGEMTLIFDAGADVRVTADGYLVAAPRIARTGIQHYKGTEVGRPDMDKVGVFRPAEEVFESDAMRSLAWKPITLSHPDESVTAKNWKKYSVGHLAGDVVRDGNFVRVPLVLMDQTAIDAVQSGKSQLSVGYAARLSWAEGKTADGELYNATQSEIRANHVAIVDKARGGDLLTIGDELSDEDDREFSTKQREKAAAKGQAMEGGGFPIKNGTDLRNAIRAVGRASDPAAAKAHIKKRAAALGLTKLIPADWGDSESDHGTSHERSIPMAERTLNLDGVNVTLEDKDGQILERHLAQLATTTADLRKQLGDAQTQHGTLTAQLTELRNAVGVKDGEIAALNQKVEAGKVTPQMLDEFCRKRMDVVSRAIRVLGDGYAFDNKSDVQIRRDVVVADMGDAATKDMSDENILGAFNHITKPVQQDGFTRMTQTLSRPSTTVNDAAAVAYNKRNAQLEGRYKQNKRPFGSIPA